MTMKQRGKKTGESEDISYEQAKEKARKYYRRRSDKRRGETQYKLPGIDAGDVITAQKHILDLESRIAQEKDPYQKEWLRQRQEWYKKITSGDSGINDQGE